MDYCCVVCILFFFFFKQKTAYEMRISDWSSDVCSSDLWAGVRADLVTYGKIVGGGLPIGVVAGQARYLDALDGGSWPLDGVGEPRGERTFFAGPFNKNPLAMAAAVAVLDPLQTPGPGLQAGLNQRAHAPGVEQKRRI